MENLYDSLATANDNAFIEKTKKQAKRLFKLAKSNSSHIEIKNLAHAQEILAQINGYPHWHAFESTINKTTKTLTDSVVKNYSDVINITAKIKDLPILKTDDYITSFFEIVALPETCHSGNLIIHDAATLSGYITELKQQYQFEFNMGLYQLNLIIMNCFNEGQTNEFSFDSLSSLLKIETSLVKKLFKFNEKFENKDKYILSAILTVTTKSDMGNEHYQFCKNFSDTKVFKAREYLNEHEFKLMNQDTSCLGSKIEFKSSPEELNSISNIVQLFNYPFNTIGIDDKVNHSLWIHSLSLIQNREKQFNIWVDINNNEGCLYSKNFSSQDETYLKGLFTSLKSNKFIKSPELFKYKNKELDDSPWEKGIPLINHTDNTLSYYEPQSFKQKSWVNLIYGPPGTGKSLLCNLLNLYNIGVSTNKIPAVRVIEIGQSSKAMIDLIREGLPSSQKHLAQNFKFKMTKDYCINIFDTDVGCRKPTQYEKATIINFLSLLVTNSTAYKSEEGVTALVTALVDRVYINFSDKFKPKKYHKNINLQIDELLEKISFKIDSRTSWWEIVDALFENGYVHEAKLAQRHAVPLLIDIITVFLDEEIHSIFGSIRTSTGENFLGFFKRLIIQNIDMFPILASPTIFDLGEAKMAVIDIDSVAVHGSPEREKQTAVMYMLARYVLSKGLNKKNVYIDDSMPMNISKDLTDKYKKYYEDQYSEQLDIKKSIFFDEYHRVSKYHAVDNQILIDMREARKYEIAVYLASQRLEDFTKPMVSLASAIFKLGNNENIEKLNDVFGLDFIKKTDNDLLTSYKRFYAKFYTNNGVYEKVFSLSVSDYLIKALTNITSDTYFRDKLTQKFGLEKALDILVKEYPDSSFQRLQPSDEGLDEIIKNLINKY